MPFFFDAAILSRMGAKPSSRFLNIGVDNQVTWPRTEIRVKFDRYHLVMMPKTKENVQSVHLDLTANKLSTEEAMTVINRFLSVMTWCDDQYAIAEGGWGGGPVPVAVAKRNLAFTTAYQWLFNRDIPASEEARRALALYREARNAEQNYMITRVAKQRECAERRVGTAFVEVVGKLVAQRLGNDRKAVLQLPQVHLGHSFARVIGQRSTWRPYVGKPRYTSSSLKRPD